MLKKLSLLVVVLLCFCGLPDFMQLSVTYADSLTYEAENLTVNETTGRPHVAVADSNASGGYFDRGDLNAAGQYIAYTVNVAAAGQYHIDVKAVPNNSRGIFQMSIDGVNQGSQIDGYASNNSHVTYDLGNITFNSTGDKQFTFTIVGQNAASSGFKTAIDAIILTPVAAAATYEAENLTVNETTGRPHVAVADSNASGGYFDRGDLVDVGQYIAYTVNVAAAGQYHIDVKAVPNNSRGIFQMSIDGVNQGGQIDGYSVNNDHVTYDLGNVTFNSTGDKQFTFTIAGKNAASSNYKTAIDAIVLTPVSGGGGGSTYYIDSVSGSDSNDGLSTGSAWQSLTKVNATEFQPGDRILFKTGGSWTGQLYPKGSGSSTGGVIAIDQYGTGSKPVINGNGVESAVYLYNQEYWEINNLEVTNNPATAGQVNGVHVVAEDVPVIHHIYVKNLYVHNVKGDLGQRDGGIIFDAQGTTDTKFDDVQIVNNSLQTVDNIGISVKSFFCQRGIAGIYRFYPITNLLVKGNTLNDIGGNGIVVLGTQDALVEYNVSNAAASRLTTSAVAMWPFASDNAVFQYNEAYNTQKPASTAFDQMAYDADFMCNGTVFQYNYSHNNAGGFIMSVSNPGSNGFNNYAVFRYNISQHDQGGEIMRVSGNTDHTSIYNNTIYLSADDVIHRMVNIKANSSAPTTYPTNISFYNNIYYSLTSGIGPNFYQQPTDTTYVSNNYNNNVFDNNDYYGAAPNGGLPNDANKITSDPQLANPGSGGTNIDMTDPNRLAGYKLLSTSPMIDAGRIITDNGGKDFWGNSLYSGAPDVGAFEYHP